MLCLFTFGNTALCNILSTSTNLKNKTNKQNNKTNGIKLLVLSDCFTFVLVLLVCSNVFFNINANWNGCLASTFYKYIYSVFMIHECLQFSFIFVIFSGYIAKETDGWEWHLRLLEWDNDNAKLWAELSLHTVERWFQQAYSKLEYGEAKLPIHILSWNCVRDARTIRRWQIQAQGTAVCESGKFRQMKQSYPCSI